MGQSKMAGHLAGASRAERARGVKPATRGAAPAPPSSARARQGGACRASAGRELVRQNGY
eukprot:7933957-Pyramimonas_sp.AAC.1